MDPRARHTALVDEILAHEYRYYVLDDPAVSDAAFAPRETVVAPGTRVTWTNTGPRNAHTVTADDGAFDSGAIGIGGTWTWTAPPRPAVLTYHCRFHPGMVGTVIVSALTLTQTGHVTAGSVSRLTGTVPGHPGEPVVIEAPLTGGWRVLAKARTDAADAFSATLPLARVVRLRARAAGQVSSVLVARVYTRVTVRREAGWVLARARPAVPGATAVLQRLDLGTYRWRGVARARLDGRSRARVRMPGAGVFRVAVLPHRGVDGGVSAALRAGG